ncbi:alkaline phosphatase family protein, partial [candidate division KSB1 bacterium]|nr:alkaline phosphatase family protein [candidate division KSB1 bacterium]
IENKPAIFQAVQTVDAQVGRLVETAKQMGITTLITSDHGSAESWLYPEGAIDTGHTVSPVHFIYIDPQNTNNVQLRENGSLADVAPTVLKLLNISQPKEMTGQNLLRGDVNPAKRVLLIITDGWGHNDKAYGNLILESDTPVMDAIKSTYPHTILAASGEAVGLPDGTVGNSEAGHMHIGAGRVVPSDRVQIHHAMKDGSFYTNEAFLWAMQGAKKDRTNLHMLGIISFFSSHGSIDYLIHLLRMAKQQNLENVYIHGLLGRRGERPESGARYTKKIEDETEKLNLGRFVSIIGRHWALDREFNWDRIEKTYKWLVYGTGNHVKAND